MIDPNDIKIIEEAAEEFFKKTTIKPSLVKANKIMEENKDVVNLDVTFEEPQILIGEKGQTLFEIQRLLRAIITKKTQKTFYLNLDINKYKQNKIDYLKKIARETADEVFLTQKERILPPMPSYERRIIHAELTQRPDIITESREEGANRCVVIKPR